jgi:hypothetical protein
VSVNSKHYVAYYDMVLRGHQASLLFENDASVSINGSDVGVALNVEDFMVRSDTSVHRQFPIHTSAASPLSYLERCRPPLWLASPINGSDVGVALNVEDFMVPSDTSAPHQFSIYIDVSRPFL